MFYFVFQFICFKCQWRTCLAIFSEAYEDVIWRPKFFVWTHETPELLKISLCSVPSLNLSNCIPQLLSSHLIPFYQPINLQNSPENLNDDSYCSKLTQRHRGSPGAEKAESWTSTVNMSSIFSIAQNGLILWICFPFQWWQVDKISPIKLFDENKTASGFNLRTLLFRQGKHELARDIVHKLFQMYNDGKVRPKIDSAWAFEDVSRQLITDMN